MFLYLTIEYCILDISGDKKKGGRGKGKATGDKGQVNDADRSVDEIITALKEQAKAGT